MSLQQEGVMATALTAQGLQCVVGLADSGKDLLDEDTVHIRVAVCHRIVNEYDVVAEIVSAACRGFNAGTCCDAG
jgi:hypothetical protein